MRFFTLRYIYVLTAIVCWVFPQDRDHGVGPLFDGCRWLLQLLVPRRMYYYSRHSYPGTTKLDASRDTLIRRTAGVKGWTFHTCQVLAAGCLVALVALFDHCSFRLLFGHYLADLAGTSLCALCPLYYRSCSGYITGKPKQRPSACVACRCSQGIMLWRHQQAT